MAGEVYEGMANGRDMNLDTSSFSRPLRRLVTGTSPVSFRLIAQELQSVLDDL